VSARAPASFHGHARLVLRWLPSRLNDETGCTPHHGQVFSLAGRWVAATLLAQVEDGEFTRAF